MQQCFVFFSIFTKMLWRNCICLWIKDYPFSLSCLKCFTFWSFLYLCNTSEHSGSIITPAVTSNEVCIFPDSALWVSRASDRKNTNFFPNRINSGLYNVHVMCLLWCRIWMFNLNLDWFCILTLTLLTWRIWWALNNASKWQMGYNSAFKGLKL